MTISVISMVQYYSSWTNYEDAIKYIMTVPKYRIKATEIAKEDGLLKAATDKKANRGKTKEQIKEQEESVLRKASFCDAQCFHYCIQLLQHYKGSLGLNQIFEIMGMPF